MRSWILVVAVLMSQIACAQQPEAPSSPPASTSTVGVLAVSRISGIETLTSQKKPLSGIPSDAGLPLSVFVGCAFNATSIKENEDSFSSTIDLRVRWRDSRLQYPSTDTPRGFYEFRGEDAKQKLSEIWSPEIGFSNSKDATIESEGLRIFPDGRLELMRRISGTFVNPLDATTFPFDRQVLTVEVMTKQRSDQVALCALQDELNFSKVAEGVRVEGWDLGFVTIKKDSTAGWYGEASDRMLIRLGVSRQSGKFIPSIFIPLLASLLIPLLAIWMNEAQGGKFVVDALELANVIIGGLFALIGLNFTINGEYKIIAFGDNTVTRLFGLNYLALAIGLLVVVLLYRFHVLKKLFGSYVQEQTFMFLSWAIPLLVIGMGATFILVALV
ncbi:MAG: hypothetical protein HQM08_27035 [Candidatus Riflebacteria bacterium]|nr:hypothetical protein [Candidatus Riflebacteria bacterium]